VPVAGRIALRRYLDRLRRGPNRLAWDPNRLRRYPNRPASVSESPYVGIWIALRRYPNRLRRYPNRLRRYPNRLAPVPESPALARESPCVGMHIDTRNNAYRHGRSAYRHQAIRLPARGDSRADTGESPTARGATPIAARVYFRPASRRRPAALPVQCFIHDSHTAGADPPLNGEATAGERPGLAHPTWRGSCHLGRPRPCSLRYRPGVDPVSFAKTREK
jgi:hypothetical protein